jgi:hypothetical protein
MGALPVERIRVNRMEDNMDSHVALDTLPRNEAEEKDQRDFLLSRRKELQVTGEP